MSGARIISGTPGRTIEAGDGPERRLHSKAPTGDGASPLHPGMGRR